MDYLIGNSVITCLLFYICSYLFGYCNWYRLIVTANLINITICIYDRIIGIPISNKDLFILYYSVSVLFLLIILINKFRCKEKKLDK